LIREDGFSLTEIAREVGGFIAAIARAIQKNGKANVMIS
jgi:hypothetical protein